uniref:Uncharacterized protein n=1 Tax=Glossina austeni TaxID=7395 RepID=A0A1A9VDT4_GLOAU
MDLVIADSGTPQIHSTICELLILLFTKVIQNKVSFVHDASVYSSQGMDIRDFSLPSLFLFASIKFAYLILVTKCGGKAKVDDFAHRWLNDCVRLLDFMYKYNILSSSSSSPSSPSSPSSSSSSSSSSSFPLITLMLLKR